MATMNEVITPVHDTDHVAVIDFGSQYTQLIVRRVRELGYFAMLYALDDFPDIGKPGAIILSGGPRSTADADAPDLDFKALQAFGVPVLGVCYGMQLLNLKFGGTVERSDRREYGAANLFAEEGSVLFEGVSEGFAGVDESFRYGEEHSGGCKSDCKKSAWDAGFTAVG